MLKHLTFFEWKLYIRKFSFYIMLLSSLALGILVGSAARISFPNITYNSPYAINFIFGLFSLTALIPITLISSQSLLREKDNGFEQILYTTPITVGNYLLSRFLIVFGVAVLTFSLFLTGYIAGHLMRMDNSELWGEFHLIYYFHSFFVLVIPNIFLCTVIVSCASWFGKNKLLIYLSGLGIYVLYMIMSIFSNSPLMAGALPVSESAMQIAALLDPFGIAAFFEQTHHWSAFNRNTVMTNLSGNFLFNRLAVLLFGSILLITALKFYRFRVSKNNRKRFLTTVSPDLNKYIYNSTETLTKGISYFGKTIFSFLKIDLLSTIKSIPFVVLIFIILFVMGMEIYGAIDGGIRLPENYASSPLMVKTILSTLPFLLTVAILFYGSEIVWKAKSVNFLNIENTTPFSFAALFVSKFFTLISIIIILIIFCIIESITFQIIYDHPLIEWKIYFQLLYFIGLPSALCGLLIISLQYIIGNKYIALSAAFVFLIFTNTSLAKVIGVSFPLIQFANYSIDIYSDMNGFGYLPQAFLIKMIYSISIVMILSIIAVLFYNNYLNLTFRKFRPEKNLKKIFLLLLPILILAFSGYFIIKNSNVDSKSDRLDRMQIYEERFGHYKNLPKPTITDVRTIIDLYPEDNRYTVNGRYTLINKSTSGINNIMIYTNENLSDVNLMSNELKLVDLNKEFHKYLFETNEKMSPGDSIILNFEFEYMIEPLKGHESFNAIVGNGAFMRISNYFPGIGYNSDMEIEDKNEREARGMSVANSIIKADAPLTKPYNYEFINFDALISTSGDQTAVSVGELINSFKKDNRNYFHYKLNDIPFRFAVSSAEYEIKKSFYKNIGIEVLYYKNHFQNIDHLTEQIKKTLEYCEVNFSKYPYKSIKFAEISSFTNGFGATAYPAAIFVNEKFMHLNLEADKQQDIINELAGHELSHQWWGNAQLKPDTREGSGVLTETLAQYTEMMLYKNAHGIEKLEEIAALHKEIYESGKAFSGEESLYKSNPENSNVIYNKGLVKMYELYQLIGEEKINIALKSLLEKHKFPMQPPVISDLISELKSATDPAHHRGIEIIFIE